MRSSARAKAAAREGICLREDHPEGGHPTPDFPWEKRSARRQTTFPTEVEGLQGIVARSLDALVRIEGTSTPKPRHETMRGVNNNDSSQWRKSPVPGSQ